MDRFRASLVAIALLVVQVLEAAPQGSRVTSLPGFNGNFASEHYAGYITVDEDRERSLYYYFVTSEGNASSDPLVLWLNGGPGCSSFDGFIYEHGPFKFGAGINEMPKLQKNPYSWTKVASVIYLDSPAGVGFSYSKTTQDYVTGDIKTAKDSHKFLLKWFELYPEFLSNPFFVTGESYAGIYVPNLSEQIVRGIEAKIEPVLNFKGYMVGNGCTDEEFDGNALVPFVHGMGLISNDLLKEVSAACDGNFWNASTTECFSKLREVEGEVSELNIYDILEPCYHSPDKWAQHTRLPLSVRMLGETAGTERVRKRMFGRAWPLRSPVRKGLVPGWHEVSGLHHLPCMDTNVGTVWLNDPAVREALHAKPESMIGKWVVCTDVLQFHHDSGSMIPVHRSLTSKGYRALIYSGDHDMCVPYTGSEAWTRAIGYKVIKSWHPWFVNGQVAGYSVDYDNGLTFTTVKGSGHTVPEYKPKQALAMFQNWIAGKPL